MNQSGTVKALSFAVPDFFEQLSVNRERLRQSKCNWFTKVYKLG